MKLNIDKWNINWGVVTTILIVTIIIALILPSLENSSSNNFNATFDKFEQNINITFKYINMTENDKREYINNSCDVVFNHSSYREMDAELCKSKIKP